jgi:hypothetical protein
MIIGAFVNHGRGYALERCSLAALPLTTMKSQGWKFTAEGDNLAASRILLSFSCSTGLFW